MQLEVNEREFHTIMAALRFWQAESLVDNSNAYKRQYSALSTNEGEVLPLSDTEIDSLCHKLNCS